MTSKTTDDTITTEKINENVGDKNQTTVNDDDPGSEGEYRSSKSNCSSIRYRSSSAEPIEKRSQHESTLTTTTNVNQDNVKKHEKRRSKSRSRSRSPRRHSSKDNRGRIDFRRNRPNTKFRHHHSDRYDQGFNRNRHFHRNNNYRKRRNYSPSPSPTTRHSHSSNGKISDTKLGNDNGQKDEKITVLKPSDIKNNAKQSAKSFLDMLEEKRMMEAFPKTIVVTPETKKQIPVKIAKFVNTFNTLGLSALSAIKPDSEHKLANDSDSDDSKAILNSSREEGEIRSDLDDNSTRKKKNRKKLLKKKKSAATDESGGKKSAKKQKKNVKANSNKKKKVKKRNKKSTSSSSESSSDSSSDSSSVSDSSSSSSSSSSSNSSSHSSSSSSSDSDSSSSSSSSSDSESNDASSGSSSSSSSVKKRKKSNIKNKKKKTKESKKKRIKQKSIKQKKKKRKLSNSSKGKDKGKSVKKSKRLTKSDNTNDKDQPECPASEEIPVRDDWPGEMILYTKTEPIVQFSINKKLKNELSDLLPKFESFKSNGMDEYDSRSAISQTTSSKYQSSPKENEENGHDIISTEHKQQKIIPSEPMKLDMNHDYDHYYQYYRDSAFPYITDENELHLASHYCAYYRMFNSYDYNKEQLTKWSADYGFRFIETNKYVQMSDIKQETDSLKESKEPNNENDGNTDISLDNIKQETKEEDVPEEKFPMNNTNPIEVITTNKISSSISSDYITYSKLYPPYQDSNIEPSYSPPPSPPAARPVMTVLETTDWITLPNGIKVGPGTKQIIVHPYNRPVY